jgi:hypothetical protein
LYIDCEVEIQGRKLLSDLVILKIISFDVILGIDWLLRNYALMDYWNQKMIFKPSEETKFAYHRDGLSSSSDILLSIMKKMVQKSIQGFFSLCVECENRGSDNGKSSDSLGVHPCFS